MDHSIYSATKSVKEEVMKNFTISAIVATLILGAASSEAATVSCGAGYVTAIGLNQPGSDSSANFIFRLDNSLLTPDESTDFYTDANGNEWILVDDGGGGNFPSYTNAFAAVHAAFLAGAPVTAASTGGTCARADIAQTGGTTFRVNVCSSADDSVCSKIPN